VSDKFEIEGRFSWVSFHVTSHNDEVSLVLRVSGNGQFLGRH
jgi:hypothetical protein